MVRSFLLAPALAAAFMANAQQAVHQVLVLNEGYYDNTAQSQVVPVSLGSYDPSTGIYQTVATINGARFGSDVEVDGNVIYVAADTLLLKFDANNYAPLGQAVVRGIRKIAIWNSEVLITRGELGGLPHYFEARDKNTLALDYAITPLDGLLYSAEDVQVADDKAYIAVNNGFDFPNYTGIIGVIDLVNGTYGSEINLGPDGLNPENLMVTADAIYALNNKDFSGSSISKVGRSDGTLHFTQNVAMNSGCGASALVADRICYQEYSLNKVARFDVTTDQVLDTLQDPPSLYGLIEDPINQVMYGTTTDFFSVGALNVMDYAGHVLSTVPVSVSPGHLALDVRMSTGITEAVGEEMRVYPNPAQDEIFIAHTNANSTTRIIIVDATGRVVMDVENSATTAQRIDVNALASGIYTVRVDGTSAVRFAKR